MKAVEYSALLDTSEFPSIRYERLTKRLQQMIFLWLVTVASLVVACAAWRRARQAAQRLDQLSQMYWELKYQYGELRQRQTVSGGAEATPAVSVQAPAGFVSLQSLKR